MGLRATGNSVVGRFKTITTFPWQTSLGRGVANTLSVSPVKHRNRHEVSQSGALPAEATSASEVQFRKFLEDFKDYAIITLDTSGYITSWNEGAARIKGYTADEIVGKHFSDLYPPEDQRRGKPERHLKHAAAKGRWTDDGWRVRKDGSRFWASVVVTALRDERGSLCGFAKVTRDDTARKRAEEALRESAERFRSLFQGVSVGVVLTGPHAEARKCNQAALDLLGLTEDQLLGRTSFDPEWKAVNEDGSPCPGKDHPIPRAIATRQPVRNAVMGVYRSRPRNWIWVLVSAEPRLAADGSVSEVVCSFTDITERQRAEEELRASEERFRNAFAHAATGMALTNLEGRFLEVNQAFCKITGYTATELASRDFPSITHPDDLPRNLDLMRQILAGTIPSYVIEKRYLHKSGGAVWARISVSLLRDSKYRPQHMIALVEDITERKQAEESLRELSGRIVQLQDEERRRLARELHDSTAQNIAALGMNLGIVDQAAGALDAGARRALAESLALANQSIRELRTFSYLLHPPRLDDLGLSSALAWYIEGFTERSGIGVKLEIAADLGRMPRELELMLFRIVQESLTNIHRHSGSRTATIRIARHPKEVVMKISDQGHGMPFNLNGGVRSPAQVGVGIAGMRERVRHMGGRLEIRCRKSGTDVEVVAPLGDPPA